MTDALLTEAPATSAPIDRAALTSLLEREEASIRRVIAGYVRHASAIDDLFQEVAAKCMIRLDAADDVQHLRGWLYQVVRTTCIDYLRRTVARPHQETGTALLQLPAHGDAGRAPVDHVLSQERIAAIERAMERLPATQREVLHLRVRHDLDHAAIASRLGISRQAVEVRLCRARSSLRAQLDPLFDGDL